MSKISFLICALVLLTSCGGGEEATKNVIPTPTNKAPTVSAGSDITVSDSNAIKLEGSATDSDGIIASYSWAQISGPSIELVITNSASLNFSVSDVTENSELVFELTATDNQGKSAQDRVSVYLDFTIVDLQVSTDLYGDAPVFQPGQSVYLSDTSTVQVSDVINLHHQNASLSLYGLDTGGAIAQIPTDIEVGEYLFKGKVDTTIVQLSLKVDASGLTEEPIAYADGFIAQMVSELSELNDNQLAPFITELQAAKEDLASLDAAILQQLALALYTYNQALADAEFIDLALPYSQKHPGFNRNASFADCTSLKRSLVKYGGLTVIAIGGFAVAPPEPLLKVVLAGLAITSFKKFKKKQDSFYAAECLGLARFANLLNNTSVQQSLQTRQLFGKNLILAKAQSNDEPINWYDNDEQILAVTFTTGPASEVQGIIDTIQTIASKISLLIPDSILTAIAQLDAEKTIDATNQVELAWNNSELVNCTQSDAKLRCGFPLDGNIHEQHQDIAITITHPQLADSFEQLIRVQPRDVPLLNDQTFYVVPGPGQVNRIVIQYTEDTNSPNYELNKIIGFKLLSKPQWGVILNEFNQFATLDYAADIVEGMPESVHMTIAAWNRYGWSENVTITLVYQETPPPVAEDITFAVEQNKIYSGALIAENADTYEIQTNPSHGVIESFNSVSGSFVYKPDSNYVGVDSFTYAAENVGGMSNLATATINVYTSDKYTIELSHSDTQEVFAELSAGDSFTHQNGSIAVVGIKLNGQPVNTDALNSGVGWWDGELARIYMPSRSYQEEDITFAYTFELYDRTNNVPVNIPVTYTISNQAYRTLIGGTFPFSGDGVYVYGFESGSTITFNADGTFEARTSNGDVGQIGSYRWENQYSTYSTFNGNFCGPDINSEIIGQVTFSLQNGTAYVGIKKGGALYDYRCKMNF